MNAPKDLILLDCRGMQCPAPILQLARTARQHRNTPVVLEVQADDQDFPIDVRAWCRTAQATILREETEGDTYRFWLGLNGADLPAGFGAAPEKISPPQILDESPSLENSPWHTPIQPETPEIRAHAPVSAPVRAPVSAPPVRAAATPGPVQLDLRGEPISAALLTLSAQLLESPRGVRVLVDAGEAIGSIYTWANATQSVVERLTPESGAEVLFIQAHSAVTPRPAQRTGLPAAPPPTAPILAPEGTAAVVAENRCTLLVLHNDFEALMAALMVANAAAAQMMSVEVYFSFWGINLLRADHPGSGEKKPPFLQRMMAWMMPAGPKRQTLGQMNFGGMGTGMMTHLMRKGNILSLSELMDAAEEQDVKFVGCTMSMGLMGVRKCNLVERENLSYGGVTAFVEAAQRSKMSMVF